MLKMLYSKVAVKRSPSRDPQTMKSTKNTKKRAKSGKIDIYERDTKTRNCKKNQNLGKSTYMKGTRRPEIVKIYLKLVKNQKCNKKHSKLPLKNPLKIH